MPLYIKDDRTADLVAQLAKLRGLSKQDAVRLAVQAELDRAQKVVPLRARVQALGAAYPLPPPTGKIADKDFFDDVSGSYDHLCGCVRPHRDHHRGTGRR